MIILNLRTVTATTDFENWPGQLKTFENRPVKASQHWLQVSNPSRYYLYKKLSDAERGVRQSRAVAVRGGDADEAVPPEDPGSDRRQRGLQADDQAPADERRSRPVRRTAAAHIKTKTSRFAQLPS